MLRRLFSGPSLRIPSDFPENTEALRKMVYYRCTHAGTKEVEIILKRWADIHLAAMNREQLMNFHQEILFEETPDLYNIFMKKQETPGTHYVEEIMKFLYSK